MILVLSLLFASLALATEPETVPAAPSAQPEHIQVLRGDPNNLGTLSNLSVTISCGSKPGFDYTSEPEALNDALIPVSGMNVIISMEDATGPEITAWFSDLAGNLDDPFRLLVVSLSCSATDGDEDREVLSNGMTFADLAKAVRPVAASSLWLLDTSREGYGITADDVAHAGLPDAFAVSTGAPGKIAQGGLIGAAAKVIKANGANALSLDSLYYTGIKPMVPNELYTSTGINPNDAWSGNGERVILPAGPLIASITDVQPPTVTRRKIPPGYPVAGAGALFMIGGAVLAGEAGSHYNTLKEYNQNGGVTQAELTTEIEAYRRDAYLAIGLGALGGLMTAGGAVWIVVDRHPVSVTVTPMGIAGKF